MSTLLSTASDQDTFFDTFFANVSVQTVLSVFQLSIPHFQYHDDQDEVIILEHDEQFELRSQSDVDSLTEAFLV